MTFGKGEVINWNTCIDSNGNRAMTENRKRSREDEVCEFMPLSKRINNLHIVSPAPPQETIQHNGIAENGISSSISSTECIRRPSYDPGINSSQSNYYFDNKLLFELHLERIQRSGQQFPF